MPTVQRGIQILSDAGIFAYLVPFLLAVALVYGLLEHFKVLSDQNVRSLISILVGILVLPLGGVIFPFLEGLTLGLMVIVATVLVLLMMAASTGIKGGEGKHLWEAHPEWTGVAVIMSARVVFISAGGPELLGLENVRLGGGLGLAFFLGIIALGVWWIAGGSGKS